MFYYVLVYDLDLVFFAIMGLVAALYADRGVLKKHASGRPRWKIWTATLLFVSVGLGVAYKVGEVQRERLRIGIQGVAPTYADAFKLLGHAKLSLDTPPDDPDFVAMIERQKEWLRSYPVIADIYTMRRLADGKVVFFVDSETDYNHDADYLDDREERTALGEEYTDVPPSMSRALAGETVFDDTPITDRWGTTVSAMTPLYDMQGKVDGIVGIDFAADDWIRTLLLGRGCVLATTMTFLIGLLVLISVSHLQRVEICLQRQFGERLQEKNRAVEEALRQLEAYQFVLDTHAMVCVTDTDGAILHVNNKFATLLGHTEDALIGQHLSVIDSARQSRDWWNRMWKTVGSGQVWQGEICSRSKHGSFHWVDTTIVPYTNVNQQITQHIAMGTDITAKKLYESELVAAARLDRLTGLANRTLFHERLKYALLRASEDESCRFALLFIDFDGFKAVNDQLGHDVGDLLLREIAGRLRSALPIVDSVEFEEEGVTVARLGGDEFVILLWDMVDECSALDATSKLLEVLNKPYHLDRHQAHSTASIGVVHYDPSYTSVEQILRDADAAMYAAKARGKACYAVFDSDCLSRSNEMLPAGR